ncbi:MAG: hypothetical protein ACK42E_03820 [Candidatus Bipolaricaulaceae bacterium]
MGLEDLLTTLGAVKARMEKFRLELQKSEALTRYALIDPVLRALGWNTEDPEQVRPEFPTETGSPDYALLHEGKPWIMVEAKALGKKLDEARDKGFQYCWKNKIPYYVITDGNVWEVHDLHVMGGRDLLKVTVADDPLGEAARSLLALWRPAMPSVKVPPPPIVEAPRPIVAPRPADTFSLPELEQKIKGKAIPPNAPPPREVVLPDGTKRPIKYWKDLFLHVVEWSQSRLKEKVPLIWPGTGRVLIATDPSGMRAPKNVGPFWVETSASALYAVMRARFVLEQTGQDPASVGVVLK